MKSKKVLFLLMSIFVVGVFLFMTCCNKKAEYKISFIVDNEEIYSVSVKGDYKGEMPEEPNKTGFIFGGWYVDSNSLETQFSKEYIDDNKIAENIKIYSKWNPVNYTVRFDGNGATDGEMEKQDFTYNQPKELNLNDFQRADYTFVGWSYDGNIIKNGETINNLVSDTNEITFKAEWSYDILNYEVVDGNAIITGLKDLSVNELIIPDKIFDYPVTEIKDNSFEKNSRIRKLVLPDSMKKIGSNVFSYNMIEELVLSKNLISIGKNSFYCNDMLPTVSLPDSLENIGDGVFNYNENIKYNISDNCCYLGNENNKFLLAVDLYEENDVLTIKKDTKFINLSNFVYKYRFDCVVVESGNEKYKTQSGCLIEIANKKLLFCYEYSKIPQDIKIIGEYAFYNNQSKIIDIPDSVDTIEQGAFRGCLDVDYFRISYGNDKFVYENNCLIDLKNKTLIYGKDDSVIPDYITTIGAYSFYNSEISYINIPDSVTEIAEGAFNSCYYLYSINFSNNLTKIGNYAFFSCIRLNFIELPDTLKVIGSYAFCDSDINAINFGNGIETIEDYAFMECSSLTEINIPDSCKSIGEKAFGECNNLISLKLSNNIETIGEGAFGYTSIEQVEIPESIKNIAGNVFECNYGIEYSISKNITSLELVDNCLIDKNTNTLLSGNSKSIIPYGVEIIGKGAFAECVELQDIVIPSSVITICDEAFLNCSNLSKIVIPDSVKYIGDSAFENCSNVTSIYFGKNINDINAVSFIELEQVKNIILNPENQRYYEINNCLIDKKNNELILMGNCTDIPDSVKIIGSYCSVYNKLFDTVNSSVLRMMYQPVYELILPEGIEEIKPNAFCHCSFTKISLPDTLKIIGENSFEDCKYLEKIEMGKNVEYIGANAFVECSRIKEIDIPDKVTEIKGYTFYGCEYLKKIKIGKNLKDINAFSFYHDYNYKNVFPEFIISQDNQNLKVENNCLIDITTNTLISAPETNIIPECVTTIGDYAFYNSSIGDLKIPDSVTKIGAYAFCSSTITNLTLGKNLTHCGYDCFLNCYSLNSVSIASLEDWTNICFESYYANPISYSQNLIVNEENLETLEIDDTITKIQNYAFCNCSLQHIVINGSVSEIGEYAFSDCKNLIDVSIASDIQKISGYAFNCCSQLQKVEIEGNSLKNIGDYTFKECNCLKEIDIPSSVESIGIGAFNKCHELNSVVLPENLTEIDDCVFESCFNLTQINIPDNVERIGNNAFYSCGKITELTLGSKVNYIGDRAFWGCYSMEKINIPDNVIDIMYEAFCNCVLLKNCIINDKTEIVRENAFNRNSNVKNIIIPESVKKIEPGVFLICNSLESIKVSPLNAFYKAVNNCVIEKATNKLVMACGDFSIPQDVKIIGEYSLSRLNIKNIILPDSVTEIEQNAFFECNLLESVALSVNLKSIGSHAFENCFKLESIEIPESVTNIGESAFNSCHALESIRLSKNIEIIPPYTFCSCHMLDNVVLPEKVQEIGSEAFYDCSLLKDITLSKNLLAIGSSCFDNCKSLTKISIPESVVCIGRRAFSDCVNLEEITLPQSLKVLNEKLFDNCINLSKISFSNDLRKIESYCFYGCEKLSGDFDFSKVTEISYYAFTNCKSIKSIKLGNSLIEIGYKAFANCENIESIIIPENLNEISVALFDGCSKLKNILILSKDLEIYGDILDQKVNLENIFYYGDETYFNMHIYLSNCNLYDYIAFYSESEPDQDDYENNEKYWHYVEDVPVLWDNNQVEVPD